MDVSSIAGVPISFFIAEDDITCRKSFAEYYIDQMTLIDTNVQIIEGEGHFYFANGAHDA